MLVIYTWILDKKITLRKSGFVFSPEILYALNFAWISFSGCFRFVSFSEKVIRMKNIFFVVENAKIYLLLLILVNDGLKWSYWKVLNDEISYDSNLHYEH